VASSSRAASRAHEPAAARVYGAAQLFARFGGTVRGWQVPSGGLAQDLVELVDARLDPGPDVVRPGGRVAFEGEDVCPGHVLDVDVVAGLLPAPVDGRSAAGGEVSAEDGTTPASPCGSWRGP
jgi:hypothetical protein